MNEPGPSPDWWVLADSAWAGPGQVFGRCALAMSGSTPAAPAPIAPDRVPPAAVIHRVSGTLLPGLRDAHVHTGLIDLAAVRRGGIAAVTDLGGVPADLARLRRQSLEPDGALPALEMVGAFLTAPGGYPSDRSWAAPGSWRELRSPADATDAVAEQVQFGASALKVAINPEAGPVPTAAVLAAVVTAARSVGRRVIAHAQGSAAVRAALDAGVAELAHTPWTEPLPDDLARESARAMTWISTLDIHGRPGPAGSPAGYAIAIDNLRVFLEHGGTVRYGTDLGNGPLPAGVNPGELRALLSAGLGVDEVLRAMTSGGGFSGAVPPVLLPTGLDRDPATFARTMTSARVLADPTAAGLEMGTIQGEPR